MGRILIVSFNPEDSRLVAILSQRGHRVTSVEDPANALEFHPRDFDSLVCDDLYVKTEVAPAWQPVVHHFLDDGMPNACILLKSSFSDDLRKGRNLSLLTWDKNAKMPDDPDLVALIEKELAEEVS